MGIGLGGRAGVPVNAGVQVRSGALITPAGSRQDRADVVGHPGGADATTDEIVKMMVGRGLGDLFLRHFGEPGSTAMRVQNLSTAGKLRNAGLGVRYGQIVGLAELVGAGRTETARTIFGLDPCCSGTVGIEGLWRAEFCGV